VYTRRCRRASRTAVQALHAAPEENAGQIVVREDERLLPPPCRRGFAWRESSAASPRPRRRRDCPHRGQTLWSVRTLRPGRLSPTRKERRNLRSGRSYSKCLRARQLFKKKHVNAVSRGARRGQAAGPPPMMHTSVCRCTPFLRSEARPGRRSAQPGTGGGSAPTTGQSQRGGGSVDSRSDRQNPS